jgi:hypothetical protein
MLRGPQSPGQSDTDLVSAGELPLVTGVSLFRSREIPRHTAGVLLEGCVWGRSALTPLALARVRLAISREHPDPKMAEKSTESEVLAQQLAHLGHKIESLETRVTEVEAVIPRLERAAETTARALEEVSAHWDAVYRAMRRAE